jgi:hypothetical protein
MTRRGLNGQWIRGLALPAMVLSLAATTAAAAGTPSESVHGSSRATAPETLAAHGGTTAGPAVLPAPILIAQEENTGSAAPDAAKEAAPDAAKEAAPAGAAGAPSGDMMGTLGGAAKVGVGTAAGAAAAGAGMKGAAMKGGAAAVGEAMKGETPSAAGSGAAPAAKGGDTGDTDDDTGDEPED